MQRITNERISAKIKQYIGQVDIDGISTIMNMTNFSQFNANNIGTINLT